MIKLSMLLNIIICNQVFYQGMKKVSLQKTFQSSMSLLNALFGLTRIFKSMVLDVEYFNNALSINLCSGPKQRVSSGKSLPAFYTATKKN